MQKPVSLNQLGDAFYRVTNLVDHLGIKEGDMAVDLDYQDDNYVSKWKFSAEIEV